MTPDEIAADFFTASPRYRTKARLAEMVGSEIAKRREVNADLLAALKHLTNEVFGSLPLMEPLARREFGNTNYNILIQRAEEARAAIAKTEFLGD